MICISTTSNSEIILKEIAAEILTKKLSPCTHILKISQSGYIWNGEIVYEPEFKLEVKTLKYFQKKIVSIIEKKHNYETFELCINQINNVSQRYSEWFRKQLNQN